MIGGFPEKLIISNIDIYTNKIKKKSMVASSKKQVVTEIYHYNFVYFQKSNHQ